MTDDPERSDDPQHSGVVAARGLRDTRKLESAHDPLDSKVYLAKRLGPFVLDAHRSRRQVTRV